jgi:hypothetical protein
MDEAERIARYAPNGEAEGLLAYALHRRALLAFRADFTTRHARAPEVGEEAAFLIGEDLPERIAAYRRDARAMMATPAPASPPEKNVPVKKRIRFPFFGQWIEAPPNYDPDQPVNWRGLMLRLVVLLLAVIGTAVLLRVLVVKA